MGIFAGRDNGIVPAAYGANPEDAGRLTAINMINAAWNLGRQAADAFDDRAQESLSKAESLTGGGGITPAIVSERTVDEPVVNIPASVSPSDVLAQYDQKTGEIISDLASRFSSFISTYFPNDSATYSSAQTWLQQAIDNGGLPATFADALMADAKTRAYADAAVQTDAVLSTFAARRFPLPPGAAASAVLQVQAKSQDAVSEAARKLIGTQIEQMRFVLEKAIVLRPQAVSASVDYIRALASGHSSASQVVGLGYDAQSKMISAAASFYNARTDAQKMSTQIEQFNSSQNMQGQIETKKIEVIATQEYIKTLMGEAQELAQIATSLFNNLNVSAHVTV